jgi:DNA polymerase-1
MNQSQSSRTLVFDIETNGLLLDVSKFWVAYTYCIETKEYEQFLCPYKLIDALRTADTIVGHNIIGYDIPALYKLTMERLEVPVIDTLILSRLAYYDKDSSFSHSLGAYGERLGYAKGDHEDWTKYSEEMDVYCKRDVEVTYKVYQHLIRKTRTWLPDEALRLEQEVQRVITQQHINGWMFDVKKARELHIELIGEKSKAEEELFKVFKPMYIPKGKVRVPKKPFRRLNIHTVGENQPIELTTFNPGSGNHIVWWVEQIYGKQNWDRTDKGNPKCDADSLRKMFGDKDWATPLLNYFDINKLLGQLAEGDNAWLKKVRGDRIHGSANILGAVTGRFTHSNPNLAQVPSIRAYKGAESRSLFKVPDGYKLVGCDASGLELRTLSHYLARYDGGKYGELLLKSDIHSANQEAAGLPTRDNAKTFIYGFLYGAGDAKIGEIVNGTSAEGKKLKQQFLAKTPGLNQLVKAVQAAAKKGYLRGVTGRRLFVRSPHAALNVLLQSAGAYIMKYYLLEVERRLEEENLDYKFVGNIHDEVQIEVRECDANFAARICEECFPLVEERLAWRCKLEGEADVGDNWADTH